MYRSMYIRSQNPEQRQQKEPLQARTKASVSSVYGDAVCRGEDVKLPKLPSLQPKVQSSVFRVLYLGAKVSKPPTPPPLNLRLPPPPPLMCKFGGESQGLGLGLSRGSTRPGLPKATLFSTGKLPQLWGHPDVANTGQTDQPSVCLFKAPITPSYYLCTAEGRRPTWKDLRQPWTPLTGASKDWTRSW